MEFTQKDRETVYEAIRGLVTSHNVAELNAILGSEKTREVYDLYCRMKYEAYCKRHGIRFEDMDEYDCELAYREGCA